jgi:NAD+ kinase
MSGKKPLTVLISGHIRNEFARQTAKTARSILEEKGIPVQLDKHFFHTKKGINATTEPADLALIFGGDGALLHFVRERKKQIPVLGVNCGAVGKLMLVHHNRMFSVLEQSFLSKVTTEKRTRLEGTIDKHALPPALNDVMLVPEKPGILVRYDLFVDGEFYFRDMADGVLVSTVTGSAAYAVSGINPKIHENAHVFLIRPVNSLWHSQPIIVSEKSKIEIKHIDCRMGIEALIDGQQRLKVKESISLHAAAEPALLVVAQPELQEEHEHLQNAMPSAKYLYWLLKAKGSLTQKEVIADSGLQERTVQRALDFLVKHELVIRQPLFSNRKQKLYSIR